MSNIKLFQNQEIRSQWDEELEQWLFSVIDVVGALSGSTNPRKYWSVLKTRLKMLTADDSELSDKVGRMKKKVAA